EMEAAGLVDIQLSKFGESPCFHYDGAELRETKVLDRKPGGGAGAVRGSVLYKGPFRELTDDLGRVLRRGERVAVDADAWERLKAGPAGSRRRQVAQGFLREEVGGPRRLVARTFARRLRLLHTFRHFRLYGVEVETGSSLHWRIIDEGREFLPYDLLDEDEAPELELEPIEVLLRAFLGSMVGPAQAFERIEAQVGDVRHVRTGLLAQPAVGLVDKAILVIVDAHCAYRAFAEVEDLVPRGRALSGEHVDLVVAVQMVFVSPVANLHAFEQIAGDRGVAGGGKE